MGRPKINKALVQEVFVNMAYSCETMETKVTMDDIVEHQSTEEIDQFLRCDKFYTIGNSHRQKLINKLASEIEKEEESFVKLLMNVSSYHIKKIFIPFLAGSLRYYSNYCELVQENFNYILVCKICEIVNFSLLGYIFGPSLAAGYRILLIVPHQLYKISNFIEIIMRRIGFPEGSISVMVDDFDLNLVLLHANTISIFDFYNRSVPNIKTMCVFPFLTPIVVFDNADIDSACDCVINATWKPQLLFDSTAKEIFVQETIFEKFVNKLKEKMSTCGKYNNTFSGQLKHLVLRAEKIGAQVFSRVSDVSSEKTMFIGGKVFDKSTIVPCISILAFRNVDEAIALANNNVQGLSASVWTENVGLANYVAQKLEVSNVWINSFGIYSIDVAFTPKKLSGRGYFGGIQGFQEFLFKKKIETFIEKMNSVQDGEKILINAITSAKKAYSSWSILPKSKRIFDFDVINQYIENNRSQFKSVGDEWLNQWKTFYCQYIDSHYDFSITSPVQGYTLNISYSGRGVLVAETRESIEDHNIKLIIASILEGNTFILLNQSEHLQKFYVGLSKELPHGIFNVVPNFKEASRIAVQSPDVETYFNEYIMDEVLYGYNKFETVTTIWKDIFNKVTYLKNIWYNIGK